MSNRLPGSSSHPEVRAAGKPESTAQIAALRSTTAVCTAKTIRHSPPAAGQDHAVRERQGIDGAEGRPGHVDAHRGSARRPGKEARDGLGRADGDQGAAEPEDADGEEKLPRLLRESARGERQRHEQRGKKEPGPDPDPVEQDAHGQAPPRCRPAARRRGRRP